MANKRITPNSKQIPVEVTGSSLFGRYNPINAQKTYNMYLSDEWLVNTAGYKRASELISGNIGEGRGLFYSVRGKFAIAVVNSRVYRLGATLFPVQVGLLATGQGEVFIDENLNQQICIVDGLNAYIYFYGGPDSFTTQAMPADLIPNYVTYHNTFFLFGNGDNTGDGAKWFAFSYATDTTITETSELALQTKPDYARAVVRLPGQSNNVLVLGTTVCEIWTNVGGTQNYRRNSTVSIDYGCISVSTIATNDQYVAWLAINEDNAPVIMVYSGQGPSRISTDGIDYQLSQIKFPDESTAMMYRQDGHLFYHLTFFNPVDNLTLIYDFNTQKFFNLSDAHLNYHPARQVIFFNNKQYFISLNNASIYEQSTNYTTYNENISGSDPLLIDEIQRIRICNTIRSEDSSRFRVNSFVFTIDQGNDANYQELSSNDFLITEITEDIIITEFGMEMVTETSSDSSLLNYKPRVDLSISKDGGVTFSNTVGRYLHPIGKRQNMLQWENMGSCNNITIKLRFWSSGRWIVNNGFVEVC